MSLCLHGWLDTIYDSCYIMIVFIDRGCGGSDVALGSRRYSDRIRFLMSLLDTSALRLHST